MGTGQVELMKQAAWRVSCGLLYVPLHGENEQGIPLVLSFHPFGPPSSFYLVFDFLAYSPPSIDLKVLSWVSGQQSQRPIWGNGRGLILKQISLLVHTVLFQSPLADAFFEF